MRSREERGRGGMLENCCGTEESILASSRANLSRLSERAPPKLYYSCNDVLLTKEINEVSEQSDIKQCSTGNAHYHVKAWEF